MLLLRLLSTVICAVLIYTAAVSAVDVKKAVGDRVSFRPDKLPDVRPVTSVIWKQINTGGNVTVKAIEWDEGEILIPNPRFKVITTVDEKTGQITITNLKVEHSGVYFFEINSKEQQQRFSLTVMERVPKPVIKTEPTVNPDVVYLRCEYSEKIIWKNSAGETLKGSKQESEIGEFITVEKKGIPENFYTCTLDNGVSEETSDRVYERDLFKDETNGALLGLLAIPVLLILALCTFCGMYKTKPTFRDKVNNKYLEKPCIGAMLRFLNGKEGKGDTENPEEKEEINKPEVQPNDNVKLEEQTKIQEEAPQSNDNRGEGDYVNSANMAPKTDKENENE